MSIDSTDLPSSQLTTPAGLRHQWLVKYSPSYPQSYAFVPSAPTQIRPTNTGRFSDMARLLSSSRYAVPRYAHIDQTRFGRRGTTGLGHRPRLGPFPARFQGIFLSRNQRRL